MENILVLDGNNFSDEEGFYNEVDKILTKNLDWKTGHNLNAFNDLLRGGFGVHDYEEPISLKWANYEKSKKDLGEEFTDTVMDIILSHEHVEFLMD
ncbi:barstar family protein [Cytophaga aurantiaca]|uniref:barstar family protein n=1 Tax=Cytophaga aurantiaca TaxID=29530 RepID=UPI00039B9C86|nr:barstar family protein [Cytophaga aurantiaca]